MNVIELRNVWKTYKLGKVEVNALQGINIGVKRGEFIAIMGSSGSGKSTAMNMMGALDMPSKGAVYLDGKNIANFSERKLSRIRGKKIGFVFQSFNLIPTLNCIENVEIPMFFQNMGERESMKRARALLEMVGLGQRVWHKPNELSGGEMQRVAIARALANDPEIILADEPTGNLDSKSGDQIMEVFEKIYKEGKTIILITHDSDIAEYAKRLIKLKDGRVILDIKKR